MIIANENQPNSRIIILTPYDKVEMEDLFQSKIDDLKTTKIICRKGSPLNLDDIDMVNPDDAKSIIVLAPNNEYPDTHIIKSVLA